LAITADPRRLLWDACYNVRDLGGFPTRDGRMTRWRTVVRADNLCRLTRHGRQSLVRYGVRTAIDLRSPDELGLESDPFTHMELDEVAYLNVPLMTADFLARYAAGLEQLFEIVLLEMCGDAIATLFTAIAVAPAGGIVIYCHAGKERTGIATALLLALASVDADVIAAEYVLSDRYLEPLYAAWIAAQADEGARRRMTQSLVTAPDRMSRVLSHIDGHYGGVTGYLRATGLDERALGLARERLVA
jgi:protein tyrosine/serine phosphatase